MGAASHAARARSAHPAARAGAVLVLAIAAAALLAAPPARGPVLFAISPGHGLDLGDLAAVLLAVLAARSAVPLLEPIRQRLGLVASSTAALAALGGCLLAAALLDYIEVAEQLGGAYDVAAPLVVALAGAWTLVAAALDPVPWPATAPVTAAAGGAALLGGLMIDAAVTPSGTLFSTAAVGCLVAVRARGATERFVFAGATLAMAVINVASLADIAGVDVEMSRSDGGTARTIAIAGLLITGTAFELVARRRPAP